MVENFSPPLRKAKKTGVEALDEAFEAVSADKTFGQAFLDWMVAVLVNDCELGQEDLYCYSDPNLGFENLHIRFSKTTQQTGDSLTSEGQVANWQGSWFRYTRDIFEQRPEDHYLNFTFSAQQPSSFHARYIVYKTDGIVEVLDAPIDMHAGMWPVFNFGYTVRQVDVALVNQYSNDNTAGNPQTLRYNLEATLSTEPVVPSNSSKEPLVIISEGDLIRAKGGQRVYIIKNGYRRWIQTGEIFNFYGHLRWEDIKDISIDVVNSYQDSRLVQLAGDERVYELRSDGTRHWITNEQEFLDRGYDWGMIYTINENEFNWFTEGDPI